jgi:hypothetical protein
MYNINLLLIFLIFVTYIFNILFVHTVHILFEQALPKTDFRDIMTTSSENQKYILDL